MDRLLVEYLPHYMRDIEEFKAIMDVEQLYMEDAWLHLDNLLNDVYVEDATEEGIKRWERILQISPEETDTLEDRRFRILARLNEQLPYTYRGLILQMNALCGEDGYEIYVNYNEYLVCIKVSLKAKAMFDAVKDLLQRIVPANMLIELILVYNQYKTVANCRYSTLKKIKIKDIRNEVINSDK